MTTSRFDQATDEGIDVALAEKCSVYIGLRCGDPDFSFIRASEFVIDKFLPEIEVTRDGHIYPVNSEGKRT